MHRERLLTKIRDRTAVVGVVGLACVGLPFAVEKARGGRVYGIEQNPVWAAKVNRGESYIGEVREDELRAVVGRRLICADTDFDRVPEMDVRCARKAEPPGRPTSGGSSLRAGRESINQEGRYGLAFKFRVVLEALRAEGRGVEAVMDCQSGCCSTKRRHFGVAYVPPVEYLREQGIHPPAWRADRRVLVETGPRSGSVSGARVPWQKALQTCLSDMWCG